MHLLICLLSSFNWCLSLFAIFPLFEKLSDFFVFWCVFTTFTCHLFYCCFFLLLTILLVCRCCCHLHCSRSLSTIIAFASHVGLNASAADASFAFTLSSNFSTDSSRWFSNFYFFDRVLRSLTTLFQSTFVGPLVVWCYCSRDRKLLAYRFVRLVCEGLSRSICLFRFRCAGKSVGLVLDHFIVPFPLFVLMPEGSA